MTKVSSLILTGIPTPYMLDQLILDSITYRMSIKRSNHNQYVDCDCMDGKFAMHVDYEHLFDYFNIISIEYGYE